MLFSGRKTTVRTTRLSLKQASWISLLSICWFPYQLIASNSIIIFQIFIILITSFIHLLPSILLTLSPCLPPTRIPSPPRICQISCRLHLSRCCSKSTPKCPLRHEMLQVHSVGCASIVLHTFSHQHRTLFLSHAFRRASILPRRRSHWSSWRFQTRVFCFCSIGPHILTNLYSGRPHCLAFCCPSFIL